MCSSLFARFPLSAGSLRALRPWRSRLACLDVLWRRWWWLWWWLSGCVCGDCRHRSFSVRRAQRTAPAVPRMRWIRTGMARVPCEPFVEGSLFLNPAALSLCAVVAFQRLMWVSQGDKMFRVSLKMIYSPKLKLSGSASDAKISVEDSRVANESWVRCIYACIFTHAHTYIYIYIFICKSTRVHTSNPRLVCDPRIFS